MSRLGLYAPAQRDVAAFAVYPDFQAEMDNYIVENANSLHFFKLLIKITFFYDLNKFRLQNMQIMMTMINDRKI